MSAEWFPHSVHAGKGSGWAAGLLHAGDHRVGQDFGGAAGHGAEVFGSYWEGVSLRNGRPGGQRKDLTEICPGLFSGDADHVPGVLSF